MSQNSHRVVASNADASQDQSWILTLASLLWQKTSAARIINRNMIEKWFQSCSIMKVGVAAEVHTMWAEVGNKITNVSKNTVFQSAQENNQAVTF